LALKTRALAASGQDTADAAKATAEATDRELKELSRQSIAAEEALNASVRPLIAHVPEGALGHSTRGPGEAPATVDVGVIYLLVDDSRQRARLHVPIRNIGQGVARMIATVVTVDRTDATGSPLVSGNIPSVIAPNETANAEFSSAFEPERGRLKLLLQSRETLVVEVAYTDVSGRQEAASQIVIGQHRERPQYYYSVKELRPLVPRQYTS
jgi:hypothetical protein